MNVLSPSQTPSQLHPSVVQLNQNPHTKIITSPLSDPSPAKLSAHDTTQTDLSNSFELYHFLPSQHQWPINLSLNPNPRPFQYSFSESNQLPFSYSSLPAICTQRKSQSYPVYTSTNRSGQIKPTDNRQAKTQLWFDQQQASTTEQFDSNGNRPKTAREPEDSRGAESTKGSGIKTEKGTANNSGPQNPTGGRNSKNSKRKITEVSIHWTVLIIFHFSLWSRAHCFCTSRLHNRRKEGSKIERIKELTEKDATWVLIIFLFVDYLSDGLYFKTSNWYLHFMICVYIRM